MGWLVQPQKRIVGTQHSERFDAGPVRPKGIGPVSGDEILALPDTDKHTGSALARISRIYVVPPEIMCKTIRSSHGIDERYRN